MSAEWTPGVCVMLGMFIVNSIDQSRLTGDGYLLDPVSAWRARLALFLGVTVMVSGVAGSVAMLCVKFSGVYAYAGYCIVAQCCLLIISSATLWIAQNIEGEYQITLSRMT
ncbi:hypothetical protein SYNPS1DRAFT_18644 [Syncephalis pseudoplumigaleata]|uniref:Uncharacterized protein n=1 Tax=Syncephalis pseudoplumigaleata TaxID=1712513 RepID=A0A4P9YTZ3_9FUNG|nr:hypothetical protein SYNPS1DRAFT_18644 [Syncephalis pseudoplumigaleata]|eukprot:RKP23416.1 hypothetical protein SYNPS1DRAFT_18644 [Syncephalis pseudoplumigaleata]